MKESGRRGENYFVVDKQFYRDLDKFLRVYEGCQNMLGVVPLTEAGYPENVSFMEDAFLREKLSTWGKQIHSDSVMVLEGRLADYAKQGYHYRMYVFEPNGVDSTGFAGGISTMCGNGVRAVAAYVRKSQPDVRRVKVMTLSGLRSVEIDGDQYVVDMGKFTAGTNDLSRYVNNQLVPGNNTGKYINSPIPSQILNRSPGDISANVWSIGLTGDIDSGEIDGEPHVVIEVGKRAAPNIKKLRKLTVKAGPVVTKNLELFPYEINLNLITIDSLGEVEAVISNCTHERNLGDDPDHSITAACGTGCTVASALIFHRFPTIERITVHNTGGDLIIMRRDDHPGRLFMKGPAQEVV